MASTLNVIALVSGGKDSLFSILHCMKHHHKIIALANLYPADTSGSEDMNSYMYQTVGHLNIQRYSEALNIPLYRQEILGSAVNSCRDYTAPEADAAPDEAESLVPLLQKVMQVHPEANAVCTGAILSTYQRTRVESVALRLRLTPLSYLWQYPILPPYTQTSLLLDMAAVGQDSRIIKVASGGLDESFLGMNIADDKTIARISKAISRYSENSNGAILGEGGEFETMTVDGPEPLWKYRLQLRHEDIIHEEGGTAILKGRMDIVDKEDKKLNVLRVRQPDLFDKEFHNILKAISPIDNVAEGLKPEDDNTAPKIRLPTNQYTSSPSHFICSNLACESDSPYSQLTLILDNLDYSLKQHSLDKTKIASCTLLLRDMSDFSLLNPVYQSYFSFTNPPARVTIAVGAAMSDPYSVMLSVLLEKTAPLSGLHVQSRSYWAPANIGPYSQAISAALPPSHSSTNGEVVYVAGQIPLVPATMAPYTHNGFAGQAALSLQHLWRIGRAKSVKAWVAGVALIEECGPVETRDSRVRTAREMWRSIHEHAYQEFHKESAAGEEEEEDQALDPWDARNLPQSFNNATPRAPIPDLASISSNLSDDLPYVPPCFVAMVRHLPRNVQIEWSATGLAGTSNIAFQQQQQQQQERFDGLATTNTTHLVNSASRFHTIEIKKKEDAREIARVIGGWTHATLYVGEDVDYMAEEDAWKALRGVVSWVPCKRVWGADGEVVWGVVVGRRDEVSE